MLVYSILTDKHSLEKLIFSSKYRAWWKLSFCQHFTDNPSVPSCVSHFMFVVHGWLNTAFSGASLNTPAAQNFLGCWMKKVRGEWDFSTAGRTLLCLTLTGVSGKSWLSCKHIRREFITHKALGPERQLNNPVWNLMCKVRTGECFCLPCREFLQEECRLVASCWRWRGTCCMSTGFKHEFLLSLKANSSNLVKCCRVF